MPGPGAALPCRPGLSHRGAWGWEILHARPACADTPRPEPTILPQPARRRPPLLQSAATGAGARAAWRSAVWRRIVSAWFAKMTATTVGISGFFVAYFWVLHHPQFPLTVMPLTAIDHAVGFQPAALPVYLSLWLYVSLAPALLKDARELLSYGLATTGLSIVGLGIFILWPTTVPPFGIDWTQHPSIEFLKTVDVASNACPSMHVAFAVFTAVWLERILRELHTGLPLRLFNGLWCLAILYSTLATRQHVWWDLLAGAVLGGVAAALHLATLRHR